jgi:hypothetical protein
MSNVINFADLQITRSKSKRVEGACQHKHLTIDEHGGVVTCDDCSRQIDPIWAINYLADQWQKELNALATKSAEAQSLINANISTKAAIRLQAAWRKRSMVPACPHCGRGVFASDGFGCAMINADIERRRREISLNQKNAAVSTENAK